MWSSIVAMTSAESVGGGIAHAESPECTPASSMCSMIPPISTSPRSVAERVDVDLDRVLEEAVDQRGALAPTGRLRGPGSRARASSAIGAVERVVVVDDLHGPAAEHVRRPDQDRVADACRDGAGLVGVAADPAGGLGDAELGRRGALNRSRSSARSIDAGLVPSTGMPRRLEASGRASAASGRRG